MKTLKHAILFLLAGIVSFSIDAQTSIGIIGGMNLAKLSFDPEPAGIDLSSRTGFGFGAVLDFGVSEQVSVRLEPMYLQKGSKAANAGIVLVEATIKADYLEIPLMLKYSLGSSNAKPYLMAGPSVGYLLSAKQTSSGADEDLKDDVKNIDIGIAAGAGVSIPAGSNNLFIEGRYSLGLTNANDDSTEPDLTVKHKGIQVFAGITFPIGGGN